MNPGLGLGLGFDASCEAELSYELPVDSWKLAWIETGSHRARAKSRKEQTSLLPVAARPHATCVCATTPVESA